MDILLLTQDKKGDLHLVTIENNGNVSENRFLGHANENILCMKVNEHAKAIKYNGPIDCPDFEDACQDTGFEKDSAGCKACWKENGS